MTARPDAPPLPLDEGDAERMGRPDRGQPDDGKTGGQSQGGRPAAPPHPGDGAGEISEAHQPRGGETERDAPGSA